MRYRWTILIVALVVVLVAAAPVARAQVALAETQNRLDRPGPLPSPGPEIGSPALSPDGERFQLVGFSQEVAANEGVLNLTLACQERFPDSRMCRAQEIARTVNVPRPPGNGFAWIQPDAETIVRTRTVSIDCQGWTSAAQHDFGTAIDLGQNGCYGGLHNIGCDTPALVACCARIEEKPALD